MLLFQYMDVPQWFCSGKFGAKFYPYPMAKSTFYISNSVEIFPKMTLKGEKDHCSMCRVVVYHQASPGVKANLGPKVDPFPKAIPPPNFAI